MAFWCFAADPELPLSWRDLRLLRPDVGVGRVHAVSTPGSELASAGEALGERRVRRRWPWQLVAGVAVLVVFAGLALAAPLLRSPYHADLVHGLTPTGPPVGPSRRYPPRPHLVRRHELARLIYGIRVSLIVAIVSIATSIVIGAAVGMIAGYFRGPVEQLLMRFTDIGLALPYTLAGLVIAAVMSAGLTRVIVIITVLFWSYPARLVYGEVLRLRTRGFVEAGEGMGGRGMAGVGPAPAAPP